MKNLRKPLLNGVKALLGLGLMGLSTGAGAQEVSDFGGVGNSLLSLFPGDTMNFARCVQGPKVIGACAGPCALPAGLLMAYKKPVAVIEVTCKAGESELLKGGLIGTLAKQALGSTVLQQSCGSMGLDKAGNTKPRYYDVHIFRVTSLAYSLSPAGGAALLNIGSFCPSSLVGEMASTPLGIASGYAGLVPVYLSELDPTWKTPLPTPTGVLNTAVASTVGAVGTASQEGICFAAGLAATVGLAPPSALQMCIGSWGLRDPVGGWVNHKNESVAAMIVAARAYGRYSSLGLVEPEMAGFAPNFSFVYPPAHPEALPGSGLRASGCYNEGTLDPRWYTKGELLLPTLDPTAIFSAATSGPLASLAGVNKGYFVATYWRDTSCCRTVCNSVPYAPYF